MAEQAEQLYHKYIQEGANHDAAVSAVRSEIGEVAFNQAMKQAGVNNTEELSKLVNINRNP